LQIAYKTLNDLSTVAEQYEEQEIDINSSDAILTIKGRGQTIVINTQTPNRQLWYSSTLSGPQRFDWKEGSWFNGRDEQIFKKFENDIKAILLL